MPGVHIRSHNGFQWLFLDNNHDNMLNMELLEQLTHALRKALERLPPLIVLTGAGEQAFCSGTAPSTKQADEQRQILCNVAADVHSAMQKIQANNIPIVALVKGSACDSGCELAALCDVIIARDDARFRLPAPAEKLFSSTITLPQPVVENHQTAWKLLQNGETIDAYQAWHAGLVHQVLPAKHFVVDARELLLMLSICR